MPPNVPPPFAEPSLYRKRSASVVDMPFAYWKLAGAAHPHERANVDEHGAEAGEAAAGGLPRGLLEHLADRLLLSRLFDAGYTHTGSEE